MLVFDSQESFDKTLIEVEKMNTNERKAWEEKLGFKSYKRLCSEIVAAEIELYKKYDALSENAQKELIKTGNYEKHTALTYEYIKKGIIKVLLDENKIESLDFKYLMYQSLINEQGFVAVGGRIQQFTDKKFKAINSLDFSKIDLLEATEQNTKSKDIYVTDLNVKTKAGVFYTWNNLMRYHTIDKSRVCIWEFGAIYDSDPNDGVYTAYYDVNMKSEKYKLWNWTWDVTSIWLSGNCTFYDGYTCNVLTHNYAGWGAIYNAHIVNITYPADRPLPSFPYCDWTATRWGGPHGIGIRLKNHWEVYLLP